MNKLYHFNLKTCSFFFKIFVKNSQKITLHRLIQLVFFVAVFPKNFFEKTAYFQVKMVLAIFVTTILIFTSNVFAKDPLIVTSINPIYQIALAITKDNNNTLLIISPNISEHDYNLKKSDAEFISKADLIFYVSNDLEYNFPKTIKSYNKISQSFELAKIPQLKILQRKSGLDGVDPHVWLNPQNAVKIAEFITKKIIEIDQKNSKKYQKNLAVFKQEILLTEKKIKTELTQSNSKNNYIFYHNGYQYFEDYFGVKAVKIVSHKIYDETTYKNLKEIDEIVREKNVKCIFGEPQDEKGAAMKLAQKFNLKFSTLDAVGKVGEGYSNLLINLSKNIASCIK